MLSEPFDRPNTPLTHTQANVLIDNDCNARVAGFTMVTMASRQLATAPTPDEYGWIQWMSPELLDPEKFGLKNNHPTVKSDIYALAMVAHQVLSGQDPFFPCRDSEVAVMVLDGERPQRPGGEPFTNEIWNLLELCWKQQPNERPTAKRVLTGLGGVSSTTLLPSGADGEAETDTDDGQSTISMESAEPGPEISITVESEPRGFFCPSLGLS
jgi:serine/threonine protein kinase